MKYLTREEKLYRIKSGLTSGFDAVSKHSIKVEFFLALVIAILMISSLLLERYLKFSGSITIVLMIIFIAIKVHNVRIKEDSISLEDALSLIALGMFLVLKILLSRTPSAIMISAISLILLYSIGLMPKIESLIESRSIFSFIVSYLLFILIIIFLFSSFYATNNSGFAELGEQKSIDFQDSLYFSAITFTTVGYGDITPLDENRILASIEAITGTVLNIAFIGYVLASRKNY
jgi:hypothetical protein